MKIAITQRVLQSGPGGYRYDALDSAWLPLLEENGLSPVLIPNSAADPVSLAKSAGCRGLILTGGNNLSKEKWPALIEMDDLAPERDRTESKLVKFMNAENLPVLGVCRGMQLLNVFHGGKLSAVEGHVRTMHRLQLAPELAAVVGAEEIETNSFHRFGMKEGDLADGMQTLALADDGTVEAFRMGRQFGIMWHPERGERMSFNEKIFKWIWSAK